MSDATLSQIKENLSAIRLLHFLAVALIVSICVRPSSPLLSLRGARAIIKSGGSSLQVFCLGAILSVMLNLFVAVERPGGIARVMLGCTTILLVAWIATALMRLRPDGRPVNNDGRLRDKRLPGVAARLYRSIGWLLLGR